eukprot:1389524-Pyramimonas_sp.AAC.1
MSDGGSEVEGVFSRGLEGLRTCNHACDAASPWQHGRCERRGGLVKQGLLKASIVDVLRSPGRLEDRLCEVLAAINRFTRRGDIPRIRWCSEKTLGYRAPFR